MGRAKQEWIESSERGYDLLSDQFVCVDCIEEPYLQSLHAGGSQHGDCDFCEQTETLVVDATVIQTQIMESLSADYENIHDAGAPYDSQEGGFQVSHEPAQDIATDNVHTIVSEEFCDAIVQAIDSGLSWCERDWLALSPHARMKHGWAEFCHVVKHKLRFSFSFIEADEDEEHPDYTHPALTLIEIGHLVEKLGLVRELASGTRLYRVRVDETTRYTSLKDLGSPPASNAAANRMSPAGIPMLYTAEDTKTALRETWDGTTPAVASIATFCTTQPIQIIDFTNLPEPPSYWSNPGREILAEHGFLSQLAADLSKPIAPGGKIDLEYAPTQIVSEYLTKAWRGYPRSWNPPPELVHGLAFRSSKTGMKNYGLNLLQEVAPIYGLNQKDFLQLVNVKHRKLSP